MKGGGNGYQALLMGRYGLQITDGCIEIGYELFCLGHKTFPCLGQYDATGGAVKQ
ncbi:hypothetical protein [Aliamphritea spongicola]|nr:hypothetical protein [Aliamphritea spongicola]